MEEQKVVMIDPKFPRQFIACACIVAVIAYGGFCLFFDYNAEVFKWLFPALNVYPGAFFVLRQVEKGQDKCAEVKPVNTEMFK